MTLPEDRPGDALGGADRVRAVADKLEALAETLPADERDALHVVLALAEARRTNEASNATMRRFDAHDRNHATLSQQRDADRFSWSDELAGWQALGADEVVAAARCPHTSQRARFDAFLELIPAHKRAAMPTFLRVNAPNLGHLDPPEHNHMRALIDRLADAKHLAAQVDERALAVAAAVPRTRPVDFVAVIARPMSLWAVSELLGLTHAESCVLRPLLDSFTRHIIDDAPGTEAESRTEAYAVALATVFRDVIGSRLRSSEQGSGSLVDGVRAVREGEYSSDELLSACNQVAVGAYEAVRTTLSFAMVTLLRHPAALDALRADPNLMPDAVEELLRFDGVDEPPARVTSAAFEMGGKRVQKGDRIYLRLAAANRDPLRFADPDRFDIRRNPAHLTFGVGTHYCPGAAVARLVIAGTLRSVLATWPEIAFADDGLLADDGYARRDGIDALVIEVSCPHH